MKSQAERNNDNRGAHRRERARCGPDHNEPGPANSPPDNSVRGRLKCVAGSDFALKARPERRHLCPHPTIAIASTVAPRLFANGEVSRNVPLLRSIAATRIERGGDAKDSILRPIGPGGSTEESSMRAAFITGYGDNSVVGSGE